MAENSPSAESESRPNRRLVPASFTFVAVCFFGTGLLGISSSNDLYSGLVALLILLVGWKLLRESPAAGVFARLILCIYLFSVALTALFLAISVLKTDQILIGGSEASISGENWSISLSLVKSFLPKRTIQVDSFGARMLCLAICFGVFALYAGVCYWMLRVLKETQLMLTTSKGQNASTVKYRKIRPWSRDCPECKSPFGWLDLLTQPSMCKKCWKSH